MTLNFSINYCNERLQQLFIELVLKQQQDEYEREGIEWVHIDYFNNQIICDLIDQPHRGILALMDEACLNVGKTTDATLLQAMDQKLKGTHPHCSKSSFFVQKFNFDFPRKLLIFWVKNS